MNRTGLVVALVTVFFAGCAAGFVGGALVVRALHGGQRVWHPHGDMGPPGPAGRALVPHLSRVLQLDARQREQVDEILARARERNDVVRDSMHAAIERVLTPEQRIRWREIMSRFPGGGRGRAAAPPPEGDRP